MYWSVHLHKFLIYTKLNSKIVYMNLLKMNILKINQKLFQLGLVEIKAGCKITMNFIKRQYMENTL